nr:hypothetical protein CFP56_14814 [Quercus suber]
MASAQSGSSSSSAVPAMASSSLPVNSSLLLLSNMSSMMTVKLDYGNYVVWKHQIEVILDTYSMIDVLDDSITAPDRFLKDSSGNFTSEINPAFIAWKNLFSDKEGYPKIGGVLRQCIETPRMLNLTNELGTDPFRSETARFLHAT